jgi:hypothetical protein
MREGSFGEGASSQSAAPSGLSRHGYASGHERLLGVQDVAEWLNLSPGWVRDHASGRRRPILPSLKLGKLLRFRKSDVDKFFETCGRYQESVRKAA